MSLSNQRNEFKKRLADQPLIRKEKYVISAAAPAQPQQKPRTQEELLEAQYLHTQTLSQLHEVLRTLKSHPTPHSSQELIRRLAFDPFSLPTLLKALLGHDKVTYDETARTLAYKPTYAVKSRGDVEAVVKKACLGGGSGVEVGELLDSWAGVEEVLEAMERDQCVFLVRGKDNVPKLCFWNSASDMLKISEEFRTLWHDTSVPPEDELQGELERVGLKGMQVYGAAKTVAKKGRQRISNKRTKITNTHLEGIDIRAEMAAKK